MDDATCELCGRSEPCTRCGSTTGWSSEFLRGELDYMDGQVDHRGVVDHENVPGQPNHRLAHEGRWREHCSICTRLDM